MDNLCECGCGHVAKPGNRFIMHHNLKGKNHHNWKGYTYSNGRYAKTLSVGHPRADKDGYVLNHILIAEKALGKYLPPLAVIHHADGSKTSGPLVICQDAAYHNILHQRIKALKACGHAKWRKCWICKGYDSPENLYIGNRHVYHPSCWTNYKRLKAALEKKP